MPATLPCNRTPEGALFPGREGESYHEYHARIQAMCAAVEAANPGRCYDAPPPNNADLQRQWPELGGTS